MESSLNLAIELNITLHTISLAGEGECLTQSWGVSDIRIIFARY